VAGTGQNALVHRPEAHPSEVGRVKWVLGPAYSAELVSGVRSHVVDMRAGGYHPKALRIRGGYLLLLGARRTSAIVASHTRRST
jgi:hypothetical protein